MPVCIFCLSPAACDVHACNQSDRGNTSAGTQALTYWTLVSRRLGVSVIAPPAGLKSAYRREALKAHPDVNNAPDAEQRFAELSEAYGEASYPHCCSAAFWG